MKKTPSHSLVALEERVKVLSQLFEEQKAQDVVCLDISQQSGGGFADRLFIMTATSPRHARAIADAIAHCCHEHAYEYFGVEGQEVGEWVLVDMNDIVVCVFLEATRALYRLEDMWSQLPREGQS